MKHVKGIVLSLTIVAFAFAGAIAITWAQDTPALSGITAEDTHPNGCVGCHQITDDGNDYRLNVSLTESGHPNIAAMVRTVPNDCGICHKAGTPLGATSALSHRAHYADASENHFIAYYQGECLACHALNTETGAMTVKSGPKNW